VRKGFDLSIVLRGIIVCALLVAGLFSAQAGQRQLDAQYQHHKYRNSGMSFGIVIGPAAARKPVRKLRQHRPVVRQCTLRQASAIARDYGIRYQTIYRTKRAMTVVGFKRGHRLQIRISRASDCHIMR
jgi:hypothetical protein